jgi:hypothetical protein
MSENPLDASKIRQYVDQNIKKARQTQRYILLGVNVGLFTLFTLIAWIIALSSPSDSKQLVGSFIMLSIGFLTSVIMHAVATYTESEMGQRQIRQQLALKALQEAIGQSVSEAVEVPEKRKHDQVVELSDDGELVPIEEIQAEPQQTKEAQS